MLHYPQDRKEWLALRHRYISSTESSALFGLSPYSTPFELAVMKKNIIPPPDLSNERTDWGLRLQRSIAKGIADRYGVKVKALNAYATYHREQSRMGASFDYEIVGLADGQFEPNDLRERYTMLGPGILEVKNVDWLVFKQWQVDGTIEAPPHIEIQVQHQLCCIDRMWAAIGVLVGGNQLELLIRERDQKVINTLADKCAKFWQELDKGIMPEPDLPADAKIIAQIYNFSEPGKQVDRQNDPELSAMVAEYHAAMRAEKEAVAAKETAKAKILMAIADAESVLVEGFKINTSMVAETPIAAYTRKGYRNFRVTAVKAKKGTSNE